MHNFNYKITLWACIFLNTDYWKTLDTDRTKFLTGYKILYIFMSWLDLFFVSTQSTLEVRLCQKQKAEQKQIFFKK